MLPHRIPHKTPHSIRAMDRLCRSRRDARGPPAQVRVPRAEGAKDKRNIDQHVPDLVTERAGTEGVMEEEGRVSAVEGCGGCSRAGGRGMAAVLCVRLRRRRPHLVKKTSLHALPTARSGMLELLINNAKTKMPSEPTQK